MKKAIYLLSVIALSIKHLKSNIAFFFFGRGGGIWYLLKMYAWHINCFAQPEGTKGAINLFIELEKHKLNQIDGRNIITSLQKHVAFSK